MGKMYSFFLGQNGNGGGDGGYAIIKIEYPSGNLITVSHNGDLVDAPDTSGMWLYGCEENGNYDISINGTTVSKRVTITTKGQIESVWISPQIINYALIYYLGNEYANPSEAEKKYAIKTGGWNVEPFPSNDNKRLVTAVNIQTPANCKQFWFTRNIYDYGSGKKAHFNISSNTIYREVLSEDRGTYKFTLGSTTFTTNNIAWIYQDTAQLSSRFSVGKMSNYISTSWPGVENHIYIFAIGFVKVDSITGLSAYGNNINAILANAVSLFNDVTALNWMVQNCTGDFMISALSNSNFINAMNSSSNKTILTSNEHWNRFISLLSL